MNFKDAYKSYNDEINGNPKVLDTILNGKKETSKVFYMRPSLVGAVAAMVVIAVSVFGFNNISKPNVQKNGYVASENEGTGVNPADNPMLIRTSPGGDVPSDNPAAYSGEGDDTVTTADCYDYFGFDVTAKAKLPEDMTFGGNVIIDSKKSSETSKIEYCSFSIDAFSLNSPERILDVCVIMQDIPFEKDSSLQIFTSSETGEVTGGEYISANMSVRVNSMNLSKAEVEDLINSLK